MDIGILPNTWFQTALQDLNNNKFAFHIYDSITHMQHNTVLRIYDKHYAWDQAYTDE